MIQDQVVTGKQQKLLPPSVIGVQGHREEASSVCCASAATDETQRVQEKVFELTCYYCVKFTVGDLGCIYKYSVVIGDFNAHVAKDSKT